LRKGSKKGKFDKLRFLNIAQGSLEESRYYLILGTDLNYGKNDTLFKEMAEVSKLLQAYMIAIRNSIEKL
jgi:four helix bundle protein